MTHDEAYAVLGIEPGATPQDIKTAYHKAALWCHPDKNPGNRVAEEAFKRVSEAYQILKGSSSRRAGPDSRSRTERSPAERAAAERAAAERAAAERAAAERAAAERAAAERAAAARAKSAWRWTGVVFIAAVAAALFASKGVRPRSVGTSPRSLEHASAPTPVMENAPSASDLPEPYPAPLYEPGNSLHVDKQKVLRAFAKQLKTSGLSLDARGAVVQQMVPWNDASTMRLATTISSPMTAASRFCYAMTAEVNLKKGLLNPALVQLDNNACATEGTGAAFDTRPYPFDKRSHLLGLRLGTLHQGYGELRFSLFRVQGTELVRVFHLVNAVEPGARVFVGVKMEPQDSQPHALTATYWPSGSVAYSWNGSEFVPQPPASGHPQVR